MENYTEKQQTSNVKPTGQIVVGIDVGTTKIAVFVGSREKGGKVNIIGMGKSASVGVVHGEVVNVTNTCKSIEAAVKEAEKMTGVEIKEAYVGIAGHNICNTMTKGAKIIAEENHIIDQQDIDTLIQEQYNLTLKPGNTIIDIVPQDYIIDGETGVMDPVGRVGKKIECNFNLISGDNVNISNIKISMEKAGINIKGLFLEPIASSETIVSETEKQAGICLVDIGGGTTDMAIFKDGILRHTAVIQLAGNSITNDIKEGCKIMPNQAELLKTKYGDSTQSEEQQGVVIQVPGLRGMPTREITLYTLSGIISARLRMILEQVDYELKNNAYGEQLIAGIVLTGGGSKLKHIASYTEYITGITTRIGEPADNFTAEGSVDYKDPMYSTGIGLVLKGFENEDKNHCFGEEPEPVEDVSPDSDVDTEGDKKSTGKGKKGGKSDTEDTPKVSTIDKLKRWLDRFLTDSEE